MSAGAQEAAGLVERIATQLPALQVVVPMLAAPLCVLLRRPRLTWLLTMAVTWGSVAVSVLLLQQALAAGFVSYHVGGWEPPWGIEIRIDPVNAFVLTIVTAISALVMTTAPRSLPAEVPEKRHYLFYAAFLLCMTGLLGMASAGDAFNVFVFLEISSLASYTLIAVGPRRRSLLAAFRYLMIGTVGGTLFLLGVGMLYAATGTLNVADLAARLQEVGANRTVLVALACVTAGMSIKLALFPLGMWLPNAYTFAPAMVSAFLAATATKVAYYVLVRFIFAVFGPALAFGELHLDAVLMPLAAAAMLVSSTVAIFQQDLKRLLAFSSLAQIGYMVAGLSFASLAGLTGGIVHLFNHALMKSCLFLVCACLVVRLGSTRIDDLRGLGRRMPWTMAAFVVAGLSLVGVPLTVGFVSKWYLVLAAIEGGHWLMAAVILVSSLLALIYVWRVVEVAYFRQPEDGAERIPHPDPLPQGERAPPPSPASGGPGEAPWGLLVPVWVLAGASIYFGVFTTRTAAVAEKAAALLLGGSP